MSIRTTGGRLVFLAAAGLLLATAALAKAAPILHADARASVHFDEDRFEHTSVTVAQALALKISGGNSSDAQARTHFGINSASALISKQNTGILAAAFTQSRWNDILTVIDPSQPTGAPLTVTFGVGLDGLLLAPHRNSYVTVYFNLAAGSGFNSQQRNFSAGISQGNVVQSPDFIDVDELISVTVQVSNGMPFPILGELRASAEFFSFGTGIIMSDFRSTAMLTVVELPPGATMVSESGTIYPIPEPGAGAAAGLLGGLLLRRRRRL